MKRRAIPKKLRFAVLMRDGFKCRYCGVDSSESRLEIDHVHSLSEGGTDRDINNLVTSCFDCNRGKGATSIRYIDEDECDAPLSEELKALCEDDSPDTLPDWMLPHFNEMPKLTNLELQYGLLTTPASTRKYH